MQQSNRFCLVHCECCPCSNDVIVFSPVQYVYSWGTHQTTKSWISALLQTEEKSTITRCLNTLFYIIFNQLLLLCMVSCFRRGANEIFALVGVCAA